MLKSIHSTAKSVADFSDRGIELELNDSSQYDSRTRRLLVDAFPRYFSECGQYVTISSTKFLKPSASRM